MLRISSLFKNLVMSFPVKGSEELRLTRPEGLVETWGKWTLTVAKGDRESSPSLERQKVLSQEDQGPPETCISECEIWAYKVPKRSVGTKDRPLDRSTPHSFQRNGSS